MTEHEHIDSLLPAYILHAVSEVESVEVEAHLINCPQCSEHLKALRISRARLETDVPQLPAPPALRARIMAQVEAEAQLFQAAQPEKPHAQVTSSVWTERWQRFRSPWSLALPVLAAVIVALVIVLSGTGAQTTINGHSSSAFQAKLQITGQQAELVADRVPAASSGHVYEVWLKSSNGTVSPAHVLFTGQNGHVMAAISNLDHAKQVMITEEPTGGSPAPTGPSLVSFKLS